MRIYFARWGRICVFVSRKSVYTRKVRGRKSGYLMIVSLPKDLVEGVCGYIIIPVKEGEAFCPD